MVEFIVVGEFDPISITKILNILPKRIYLKGDIIRNTQRFYEKSRWICGTEYEESLDINDQLGKVLNLLQDKKSIFIQLMKEQYLSYTFGIAIKIEENQSPAIYLTKEAIQFASEIEAEFDVDQYIL